jgi:hypothetical protein
LPLLPTLDIIAIIDIFDIIAIDIDILIHYAIITLRHYFIDAIAIISFFH